MKDIHAKFGIPNTPQLSRYWTNWKNGISDFRISGQIPYKKIVTTPEARMSN